MCIRDRLGIETPILKEARLRCTLARTARRARPELAAADFPGQLHPVDLGTAQRFFGLRIGNALLPQFGPDPDRALATLRMVMHEAGSEALVADQPLAGQLLDHGFDRLGRIALGLSLIHISEPTRL